jgi:hypothetical protein
LCKPTGRRNGIFDRSFADDTASVSICVIREICGLKLNMSSRIYPDGADPATYCGLPSVYEFINSDGEYRRFNCGQAAACSLLSFAGALVAEPDPALARTLMTAIEEANPPDNFGGWFGTSRRRVERICRRYGIELDVVAGEEELRASLAACRPAIVMLGTEGPRVLRWRAPAGHWMLAYGFDDSQIFLTNHSEPGMPWDEFRRGWSQLVPRLISMCRVGLAARR